jgi:hypothetical protein
MNRRVGLGVIADNLINISRATDKAGPPVAHRPIPPPHSLPVAPAGLALRTLLTGILGDAIFAPESS